MMVMEMMLIGCLMKWRRMGMLMMMNGHVMGLCIIVGVIMVNRCAMRRCRVGMVMVMAVNRCAMKLCSMIGAVVVTYHVMELCRMVMLRVMNAV